MIIYDEIDKIINNLDIKRAPGINQINNKPINKTCQDGTYTSNRKIQKVVMLHKASQSKDLIGS